MSDRSSDCFWFQRRENNLRSFSSYLYTCRHIVFNKVVICIELYQINTCVQLIHRSKESLLSIYLCLFVAEMHYSMSQCQQREVVRVHASSLTSLTTHEAACCLLLTKINAKIKRKTGNNKEISAIGSFRMFVLK